MKTKIIYIAEDETEFDNMSDCIDYEVSIKDKAELIKAKELLQNYCSSHRRTCKNCIFGDGDYCIFEDSLPADW